MVLGGHDGRAQILHPDARGPVADCEEALGVGGVALDGVDGAVVLAGALVEHGDSVVLLAVLQVHLVRNGVGNNRRSVNNINVKYHTHRLNERAEKHRTTAHSDVYVTQARRSAGQCELQAVPNKTKGTNHFKDHQTHHEHDSLLCADQVLGRSGFGVVLKRRTTQDLTLGLHVRAQHQRVGGLRQAARVPPAKANLQCISKRKI